MKFISEDIIDQAATELSEIEGALEKTVEEVRNDHPVLLGYFFSENFKLFHEEEKEYAFYLFLVFYHSIKKGRPAIPTISENQLAASEEYNWGLMEGQKGDFRSRLDTFFKDYPEEDLLAFLEDALTEDEDLVVSATAREAIFISLKSLLDCLLNYRGS